MATIPPPWRSAATSRSASRLTRFRQQAASTGSHGGSAFAELPFERLPDSGCETGPTWREIVERLQGTDLDRRPGTVDEAEEVPGHVPQVVSRGLEAWDDRDEAAHHFGLCVPGERSRQQRIAVGREPFRVVARRLFQHVRGPAPNDGLIGVEGGDEPADESGIGTDGGEGGGE